MLELRPAVVLPHADQKNELSPLHDWFEANFTVSALADPEKSSKSNAIENAVRIPRPLLPDILDIIDTISMQFTNYDK